MAIKVNRTPVTTARACSSSASAADIRKLLKAHDEASIVLVTANGTFVLDPDAFISAEWTETVPTRSRAKKEQP